MKKIKLSILIAASVASGIAFAGCGADGNTENTSNEIKAEDTIASGGSSVTDSTETSDTDASLVATTELETNTTITTSQTDPANAETAEYMRYLKDLYNGADNYASGYPQKISGIDSDFSGVTTYLKYAIADVDGDGKQELITVESGQYAIENDKAQENIDSGYLTFRKYKTNSGGGIVQNPKINGLSNGIPFSRLEKNIKCYDNGIIGIDETDAVNSAWGYNNEEVKAYLYFENDVVKKLNVAAINEYLDSEWTKDKNSSYVLMQIDEGRHEICLGGAQDSYTEMTELTKDQYNSMENILTGGKEVDLEFKDINKENLGL